MNNTINELCNLFSRLPGIGNRTARRLVFYLLSSPEEYTSEFGKSIAQIKQKILKCSICYNFSDTDPCSYCTSLRRDKTLICVTANVQDMWAIEESGEFGGTYHILHGLLSPLDGIGPQDLHIDELVSRVKKDKVKEIIVATRPCVEGEATALLIKSELNISNVKISRIASGVPHGGELEYSDKITLGRAISGRSIIK